jgi:hypothetical protein
MRFLHLTLPAAVLAAALAGCGGSDAESTDATGTARIHLITPQVFDFQLTRVSVETNTGFTVDLARDQQTGDFGGSLALPAGVHEITGRAFVDAEQVGASNPVTAEIQAGAITQIMIQILDTTGGDQPDFGPILESLSHPTSTTVGVEVIFAASVIDLDGTPVSIAWDDDCSDSSFTSPQEAMTGWSKATPGTCRVTISAASGGQTLATSFNIAVFEAGANQGAADIVSEFISAPSISLFLGLPEGFCSVDRFAGNASCASAIASPSTASVQASVNWENATPGNFTVVDDCGGAFGVFANQSFVDGQWLPPVQGAICRVTARAISQEGIVSEMTAAVLVRPGTPRQPTGAPRITVNAFLPAVFCQGDSENGEAFCGSMRPGAFLNFDGNLTWADTIPGQLEVSDSCGGVFSNRFTDTRGGFYSGSWQAPAMPAPGCAMTITATSLEGVTRSAVLRINVQ